MDDVKKINDLLEKYPWEIHTATTRTEELREQWQLTEARKDYETAKAFLESKAITGKSIGECERQATINVYETSQTVIVAESAYRRALADQTRIENEFTAVRKMAELLKLTENHMRAA